MCFLIVVALFVAFKNTIRALADAIRMSADSLIVFANAIRKFTLVRIAQKLWGYEKAPPE